MWVTSNLVSTDTAKKYLSTFFQEKENLKVELINAHTLWWNSKNSFWKVYVTANKLDCSREWLIIRLDSKFFSSWVTLVCPLSSIRCTRITYNVSGDPMLSYTISGLENWFFVGQITCTGTAQISKWISFSHRQCFQVMIACISSTTSCSIIIYCMLLPRAYQLASWQSVQPKGA